MGTPAQAMQGLASAAGGSLGGRRCGKVLTRSDLARMVVSAAMKAEGGVFRSLSSCLQGKRPLRLHFGPEEQHSVEVEFVVMRSSEHTMRLNAFSRLTRVLWLHEGDWVLFRPHSSGDPTHFDVEGWREGPGGRWQRLQPWGQRGQGVQGGTAGLGLPFEASEDGTAAVLASGGVPYHSPWDFGAAPAAPAPLWGFSPGTHALGTPSHHAGPRAMWALPGAQRGSLPASPVVSSPRWPSAPGAEPPPSPAMQSMLDVLFGADSCDSMPAAGHDAPASFPRPHCDPRQAAAAVRPSLPAGYGQLQREDASTEQQGDAAWELQRDAADQPDRRELALGAHLLLLLRGGSEGAGADSEDGPGSPAASTAARLSRTQPWTAASAPQAAVTAPFRRLSRQGAIGGAEAVNCSPHAAPFAMAMLPPQLAFPQHPLHAEGLGLPEQTYQAPGILAGWGGPDAPQVFSDVSPSGPEEADAAVPDAGAAGGGVKRRRRLRAGNQLPKYGWPWGARDAGAQQLFRGASAIQGEAAGSGPSPPWALPLYAHEYPPRIQACTAMPGGALASAADAGTDMGRIEWLPLGRPADAPVAMGHSPAVFASAARAPREGMPGAELRLPSPQPQPADLGAELCSSSSAQLPTAGSAASTKSGTAMAAQPSAAPAARASPAAVAEAAAPEGATGPRLCRFTLEVPVTAKMLRGGYLVAHSAFAADAGLELQPAAEAGTSPAAPLGLPLRLRDASSGEGAEDPSGGGDGGLLIDATLSVTPACPGRKAICKLLGLGGWMAYRGVAEGDQVHVSFKPPRDFTLTLRPASGQHGGGQHADEAVKQEDGHETDGIEAVTEESTEGGGDVDGGEGAESRRSPAAPPRPPPPQLQPVPRQPKAARLPDPLAGSLLAMAAPPERRAAKAARAAIAGGEGAGLPVAKARPAGRGAKLGAAELKGAAALGASGASAAPSPSKRSARSKQPTAVLSADADAVRVRVTTSTLGPYNSTGLPKALVEGFFGVSDPGRAEHLTRVPLSVRPAEGGTGAGGGCSPEPLEGVRLMAYHPQRLASATWRVVGLRSWLKALGAEPGDAVLWRRLPQSDQAGGGDGQRYSVQLERQEQQGTAMAAKTEEAAITAPSVGARTRANAESPGAPQPEPVMDGGAAAAASVPTAGRRKRRAVGAGENPAVVTLVATETADAGVEAPASSCATEARIPVTSTAAEAVMAQADDSAALRRSPPGPEVEEAPYSISLEPQQWQRHAASPGDAAASRSPDADAPGAGRASDRSVSAGAAGVGAPQTAAADAHISGKPLAKRRRTREDAADQTGAVPRLPSPAVETAEEAHLAQPASDARADGLGVGPGERALTAGAGSATERTPASMEPEQPEQGRHGDNAATPAANATAAGHVPASSVSHLHGCLQPGVPLPPLQPGELQLCGLTFHPDLAPSVRRTMQEWEASSLGDSAGLAALDPATQQISIPGVDEGAGGSEAAALATSTAFARHGLRRPILATRLARHLGINTHWDAPLPSGPLPLSPDLVAPGPDPERGGAGLFARAAIKPGGVLGVVGGYVMPGSEAEAYAARGLRQSEQLQQAVLARTEGNAGDADSAWGFLAGSFRLRLPGLGPAPCGADGCELSMLGYGNEAALVNDPRRNPRAWAPGNDVGDKEGAAALANCMVLPVSVRGLVLPVLVALRDIAPGEQLLRDYGAEWWRQLGDLWERPHSRSTASAAGPDARSPNGSAVTSALSALPPPPPSPGWERRGKRLEASDLRSGCLVLTTAMTGPGGVLAQLSGALLNMAPLQPSAAGADAEGSNDDNGGTGSSAKAAPGPRLMVRLELASAQGSGAAAGRQSLPVELNLTSEGGLRLRGLGALLMAMKAAPGDTLLLTPVAAGVAAGRAFRVELHRAQRG
ncbi:hypothetical protein HYH03_007387 [Edaphochlamys debaryana]|uniref:SET domain-containing protein n=1 Tax=Edaphochlamys debaryana TaxID=47281 RepID=A0A835YB64_9CHLO|nr:hypothetical protein HYH03_007387 [Edaphochlamys debaryana]|eukprot:KAG2494329.1 hypothetical protein HYH03_007387 [Edaphochlamys debaryana]